MATSRLARLLVLLVVIVALAHAGAPRNVHQHTVVRRQVDEAANLLAGDSANADAASTDGAQAADPTSDAGKAEPTPDNEDDNKDTGGSADESSSSTTVESTTTQQSAPSEPTTESVKETSSKEAPKTTSTTSSESSESSSSAAVVESEASSTTSEEAPSKTEESKSKTTSATKEDDNSSKKEDKTSFTKIISTKVEVVTKTNDDGSKQTMTSTSKTTSTAALNADSEDSGSDGGMSDGTRNTIIGVVVGIGGAIVLGVIGIVAWRIWGRRKRAEENDALMDYDPNRHFNSGVPEKTTEPPSTAGGSTIGTSRSPFQQTLDSYHQPTPVNASSNF